MLLDPGEKSRSCTREGRPGWPGDSAYPAQAGRQLCVYSSSQFSTIDVLASIDSGCPGSAS